MAYAEDIAGAAAGWYAAAPAFAGVDTDAGGVVRVRTTTGDTLEADALVVCAGLHADVVARACGIEPEARIVPFRGEYFELAQHREHLVRGLIYPVPDPRFPFLGVHLTRMVRGGVHAGPNAVLALRREGYTWRDVDLGELRDALSWPGLWRLGRQARRAGRAGGGPVAVAEARSRGAWRGWSPGSRPGTSRRRRRACGRRRCAADGSLVDDFLRPDRSAAGARPQRALARRPRRRWRSPTTWSPRWTPSPAEPPLDRSTLTASSVLNSVADVPAKPTNSLSPVDRGDGQNSVSDPSSERWRCWLQTVWAVLVFAPVMQSSYCFCGT